MPVYRHKEDRYEIQAYGGRGSIRGELYVNLYGYAKGKIDTQQGSVTKRDIYLTEKDFNKLFELVPEYCCDWFTKCVRNRIIRKNTIPVGHSGVERGWVWDALDEWFTECPFCKTKL